MNRDRINALCAFAPVFLSLFCTSLVLVGAAKFCSPPRVDEGWEAHIFQLLMAAQLPIVGLFIMTNARPFARIVPALVLQAAAWSVAASAAYRLT